MSEPLLSGPWLARTLYNGDYGLYDVANDELVELDFAENEDPECPIYGFDSPGGFLIVLDRLHGGSIRLVDCMTLRIKGQLYRIVDAHTSGGHTEINIKELLTTTNHTKQENEDH